MLLLASTIALGMPSPAESQSSRCQTGTDDTVSQAKTNHQYDCGHQFESSPQDNQEAAAPAAADLFGATIYWEGSEHYTVAEQLFTSGGVRYSEVCNGGSRCDVPYRYGTYLVRNSASQQTTLIVLDPPEVTVEEADIAGHTGSKVTYFVLAQVDEPASLIGSR